MSREPSLAGESRLLYYANATPDAIPTASMELMCANNNNLPNSSRAILIPVCVRSCACANLAADAARRPIVRLGRASHASAGRVSHRGFDLHAAAPSSRWIDQFYRFEERPSLAASTTW